LEPANASATSSDLVPEVLESLTIATPSEVHPQPQDDLRVPLTDLVPENLVTPSTMVCEDPPQEQDFPAIPIVSTDLATEEIVSPSSISSERPEDLTTGATFANNPNEIADNPPATSPKEDKVAQQEGEETTEAVGVPEMTEPITLQMQQNNPGDSCMDVELNVLAQAVLGEEAMQCAVQEAAESITSEDLPLGEPDIQGSVDTNKADALAEEKTGQIILGLTSGDTVEQAEEHITYYAEEQQLGTEILPPKDVCALHTACQQDETSKTPTSATPEGTAQDLSEQMESPAIIGISEAQVSMDCKLLK
jgi:hypothetical protein